MAHFVKLTPHRNPGASMPTSPVLELVLTPNFCHRPCLGGQRWHCCHPSPCLYPAREQRVAASTTGICVFLPWDCRITTTLTGTPAWSAPSTSHNCCTSLSRCCWCETWMQSGPAVCSHGIAPPTRVDRGAPAERHHTELGWAAGRQQQLSGWLAAAALSCTL